MFKNIPQEKRSIREEFRAIRQSLTPDQVLVAGKAVSDFVRSWVRDAGIKKVCVYASTGKEIPTDGLMNDLIADGVTITVPDWEAWKQSSALIVVTILNTGELQREGRIVPQPIHSNGRSFPIEDLELFLVPGIAFDGRGNRLGMGGGYYDRLLASASSSAVFTGLAYDFQVVKLVPSEIHDIPVHDVVTPAGSRFRAYNDKQEEKSYGS